MEQLMAAGPQPPAPAEHPARGRRGLGALAGLLAAAVALGVAELVAALVGPASSPVVATWYSAAPATAVARVTRDASATTTAENRDAMVTSARRPPALGGRAVPDTHTPLHRSRPGVILSEAKAGRSVTTTLVIGEDLPAPLPDASLRSA